MNSLNPFHKAVYLTGPTASGKTAVGVHLARLLKAEIIALDSMTLYRGLDIGTAKPMPAEWGGVPHHLLDVLEPWETASVALYRDLAARAMAEIESRGRRVLFVGGTPMYLKALLRGLFSGPPADPVLRNELATLADREGETALHERLARRDPQAAARLHPNDRRRLIRALEVIELSGRPLSEQQTEHQTPATGVVVAALVRERADLHERINRRVVQMFEAGLVEEVRGLLAGERPLGVGPSQGVGYREVIEFLQGRAGREATVAAIQTRTRQFAKRQMTWFRGLAEVKLWPVTATEPAEETARRLARTLGECF